MVSGWCVCLLTFWLILFYFCIHNNNENPVQLAPIRFHCYSFAFGRYIIAPNLVILQLHVVIPFVSRTCIFCLAQWPTHDVFPPKPNNLKVMFGPRMMKVVITDTTHYTCISWGVFFFLFWIAQLFSNFYLNSHNVWKILHWDLLIYHTNSLIVWKMLHIEYLYEKNCKR